MLKTNSLMTWKTFWLAALSVAFAGCSDNEVAPDQPGGGATADNSVYIEASSREQNVTIEDPDTPLTFAVKLAKASEEQVAFTLATDAQWVEEHNAANGTEYVLLPERNRTMPLKLVIPAGSTSVDVGMTVTLPDDASTVDYVLPVYLADADGAAIDETGERLLYIFKKGNFVGFKPAIDGEAVTSCKVEEDGADVPFEVALSYTVDHDVTVTLTPDQSAITAYNDTYGSSFSLLGQSYYTGSLTVRIPSGQQSASTILHVTSLPESGTCALALRIASASDSEIAVKAGLDSWIVPLRKGATQAIQKAAIFTGLSGDTDSGPVNQLNLTLPQWTLEYWFRFDDNSGMSGDESTWTTAAGSTWRGRVFPSTCAMSSFAGLRFCIWPQDNNMGPVFDFTQNDAWLALPSSAGGFLLKPDTWTHLALTYDGTNLRYYVNGELGNYANNVNTSPTDKGNTLAGSNLNSPTSWNTLMLAVGCAYYSRPGWLNTSNIPYLKLELAQMRLWNRAVEQTDIQANMGLTLYSDDVEGLEGYWKMDEGSGTVLHDSSGKGHDFPAWDRLQWSSDYYNFGNQ